MAEKSKSGKAKEAVKVASSLKDFWATTAGFRGVMTWAVITDLLSSIPWVGLIFSALGYGSIWLALEIKGVSANPFGSTKRMASFAAEWIAGAFGFGIVPGITAWTYFCIAEHKDKAITQQKEALPKDTRNSAGGRPSKEPKQRQKRSAYMKDAT